MRSLQVLEQEIFGIITAIYYLIIMLKLGSELQNLVKNSSLLKKM